MAVINTVIPRRRAFYICAIALRLLVVMASRNFLRVIGSRAVPVPQPVWPEAFSAKFVSDYKATYGWYTVFVPPSPSSISRRAPQGRIGLERQYASERIDISDGTRDHLCSAYHNGTACTQLTTEGFRYLYFPDLSDCCRCCSYSGGSYDCGGPLSPKWVDNSTGNLVYVGREDVRGALCHKWNVQGLGEPPHDNFHFQSVETGLPCAVDAENYFRTPDQKADDQYIFNPSSFTTNVPLDMFRVPAVCHNSEYCGPPVCSSSAEIGQPAGPAVISNNNRSHQLWPLLMRRGDPSS